MVDKKEFPKQESPPKKQNPLAQVFPDSPGIVRALSRSGIDILEELKEKTNEEIAAIKGIQFTRYNKVLEALGRKNG